MAALFVALRAVVVAFFAVALAARLVLDAADFTAFEVFFIASFLFLVPAAFLPAAILVLLADLLLAGDLLGLLVLPLAEDFLVLLAAFLELVEDDFFEAAAEEVLPLLDEAFLELASLLADLLLFLPGADLLLVVFLALPLLSDLAVLLLGAFLLLVDGAAFVVAVFLPDLDEAFALDAVPFLPEPRDDFFFGEKTATSSSFLSFCPSGVIASIMLEACCFNPSGDNCS